MIGIDTNVLVRYLAQDDPVQSPIATRIIQRGASEETPAYVSLVTLLETVWVLESAFGYSRPEVADVVEELLLVKSLMLQNEDEVFTANVHFRRNNIDFADALISAVAQWAGCSTTLTFDRKAARSPGFSPAEGRA